MFESWNPVVSGNPEKRQLLDVAHNSLENKSVRCLHNVVQIPLFPLSYLKNVNKNWPISSWEQPENLLFK